MPQTKSADEIFQELKRSKPRVEIRGIEHYVVEGDLVLDENELLAYALREAAAQQARAAQVQVQREGLVGILDEDNRHVRWAKGLVLTYAVLRDTFRTEAEYDRVVDAMRVATADWEALCGVDFEYRADLDDGFGQDERPVFVVRHFEAGGRFIASAFFPYHSVERREVLIDPSFHSSSLTFSREGILRHELGHVLGFRHEHIRSGAPPICPDESTAGTVDLTAYDPRSVMHYFCGGVGSRELEFTELDRQGAQLIYGLPDVDVKYYT